MNRIHVAGLTLALLSLGACSKAPPPAATAPANEPQTALGKVAAKAIDKARTELQTQNLNLDGSFQINGRRIGGGNVGAGLAKGEITPQGDLLIDGKAVSITPQQRQQLLTYRSHMLGVAEAGMAVGLKGADLAGKALTESLGSLLSGNTEEVEKKIEAEGKKLEADAMQICAQLPPLLAAQEQLAATLPEFKPYATMTQADVDECARNSKGMAVFSDDDKAKVREEVRTAVREAIRGGSETQPSKQ